MSITFINRERGTTFDDRRVRFPAGESHVTTPREHEIAVVRFEDDSDLMTLAMWANARKLMGLESRVAMPYLPGARQDRGVPLGAKVYADFINSMELTRLVCLDPHSEVMPALLNNLRIVPIDSVIPHWGDEYVGVIAPDVGARKRAEAVAAKFQLPVFQAFKHRDFRTGQLSGFTCEDLPEGRLLLVDDICDGGGTFIGLAQTFGGTLNADLWVTHGVFSKGLKDLSRHFRYIRTTDSVPGSSQAMFVTPLLPYLTKELYS